MGWIYEKNGGQKSRDIVPLSVNFAEKLSPICLLIARLVPQLWHYH